MKTAKEFFEEKDYEYNEEGPFSFWRFSDYKVIEIMQEYGEYMFNEGYEEGFSDGKLIISNEIKEQL
jgi:hypothetical protein